jgi:hypothetical protein
MKRRKEALPVARREPPETLPSRCALFQNVAGQEGDSLERILKRI